MVQACQREKRKSGGKDSMTLPVEGIKVVDLTQWFVGSVSSGILAEWGADVVKIESPQGGDPLRGILASGVVPVGSFNYFWALANRNKRSVVVDLTQERGKEILYKLVEKADVFVSNFRMGSLERLKLDYDNVVRMNPRLIYAHANAYGQQGPEKEKPGFDETAFWARGGFMDVLGEPGTPPVPLHGAIGDLTTSLFLLGGIMSALYVRERTGMGQVVNTSLLGCGVWVMGLQVQVNLATGQGMLRESRTAHTNPLYNMYRAQDGKWFQLSMLQSDRYWPGLCQAIGRENLEHDPRFDSHENRSKNHKLLIALLDEVFATKPWQEWRDLFDQYGIVYGAASSIAEVAADPQVWENGYITEVEDPRVGRVGLMDCPIQLRQTPGQIRDLGPELGQHTEEVLLELGYTWDDIAALKGQKVIG